MLKINVLYAKITHFLTSKLIPKMLPPLILLLLLFILMGMGLIYLAYYVFVKFGTSFKNNPLFIKFSTFIGAFMSVNGIAFDHDRNPIVADGVMHTVQVFSAEDGSYMYHMGDYVAVPDESAKDQRPAVNGLQSPAYPDVD